MAHQGRVCTGRPGLRHGHGLHHMACTCRRAARQGRESGGSPTPAPVSVPCTNRLQMRAVHCASYMSSAHLPASGARAAAEMPWLWPPPAWCPQRPAPSPARPSPAAVGDAGVTQALRDSLLIVGGRRGPLGDLMVCRPAAATACSHKARSAAMSAPRLPAPAVHLRWRPSGSAGPPHCWRCAPHWRQHQH